MNYNYYYYSVRHILITPHKTYIIAAITSVYNIALNGDKGGLPTRSTYYVI